MLRKCEPSDLATVRAWWRGHGLPALSRDALPAFGVIVPGVAAGFLLRTESVDVAILDSFVTNPKARLRARHEAVVQIAEALAVYARGLGVTRLLAFTESRGIGRVAEGLGYRLKRTMLLGREVAA